MIWLASFPRSGNTFFRIVLDEVYGIQSSTFHREKDYPVDEGYASYPVVKTHLLPGELVPGDPSIPAVYLVRDGRDCVVSLAHYRRHLLAPESDFELNLQEAIDALEGSYFGGWSEHVRRWSERASLVIRFEDFIVDPIGQAERMRPWLDMPEPQVERLPSFVDLRSKDFRYGSGVEHRFAEPERRRWRTGKFRRGRAGAWRDELPERFHLRFLRCHGRQLTRLDYLDLACDSSDLGCDSSAKGSDAVSLRRAYVPAREEKPLAHREADGVPTPYVPAREKTPVKRRVLIDATKILDARMDGIRRYVQELLRAMVPIARRNQQAWEIDVRFGANGTFPLLDVADDIERGQPPLEEIPRLFRPDEKNPINACKNRLSELKGQMGWERVRQTVRLNYFKTCRSVQKRWHTLRALGAALSCAGREPGYDLIHLTLPNTWAFYGDLKAPFLTTVHDLSHKVCPQFQAAANNRSLAAGLRFARNNDSDYVADSHATKEQMVRLLGLDPQRIAVVHLACDFPRYQPVARAEELRQVRRKYGIPDGPYVLSVGTLEPRKNLINTVQAFGRLAEESPNLGASLVIAGSFGWGSARQLDEAIRACPRIRAIGYVDDHDLPALYSGAAVFSYVSHYEGFGLPLLEAMGCGVPTVYGNVSSMPEIVGDAGLPAAPNDVQQIKRRLRQLLEDHPLRRRLSQRAVLRSLDFSWQKTAEETLACYEQSIQARSAKARTARVAGGDADLAGRRGEPMGRGGKHAAA